jgi:ubiquinone/menaquinone biosynthesis C-methylase UbiE
LRLIDVSHSSENIAEHIKSILEEYDLTNKVFSITLDNASTKSKAMDIHHWFMVMLALCCCINVVHAI